MYVFVVLAPPIRVIADHNIITKMAVVDQVLRWPNMTASAMVSGSSSTPTASMKPVPMKLFSTWEIDKSTPSCIPRLALLID
jgi:hypothetical protein